MIGLIIQVLLAIATSKTCSIGQPVDYYAWVNAHPNYHIAWSTEGHPWGDYWIMQGDDGENLLFKFKQPIADTIATGASHGECARYLGKTND